MRTQELRIGNWVKGNKEYQIDIQSLVSIAGYEKSETPYANPIPLTEEWLLRLGFMNDIEFWYVNSNNELRLYISASGLAAINDDRAFGSIRHVHQLQNLYFALTGEELTIKQDEV